MRHSVDLSTSPVISIGKKLFSATTENISAMKESGELAAMLREIGWIREQQPQERMKSVRKLKHATWKRTDESEVQIAIRKAKRR